MMDWCSMSIDRRFVTALKLPMLRSKYPALHSHVPCVTAVILFLAGIVGCGGSGVAPVSGRVTLDGRPLEHADVMFQPDGSQRLSAGRTDADGRYELAYKRGEPGAIVGEHSVRIYVSPELVRNPPRIPSRYDSQSELRVEVKPDDNVFNFDLESDKK
jgi:hypothetical protein